MNLDLEYDFVIFSRSNGKTTWCWKEWVEDCPSDKETSTINKLVTVLLNFHDIQKSSIDTNVLPNYVHTITTVLKHIQKEHPKVKIICSKPQRININDFQNVEFRDNDNKMEGQVWNEMIDLVKTPFTFVGRDIADFDNDTMLVRLLRVYPDMGATLIGGATRTINNGHWYQNCHQVAYRNYTLVYKAGYHHSGNDCLYCDYFSGPFIMETSQLKSYSLNAKLPNHLIFRDLLFRVNTLKRHKSLVCPDAMFNVFYNEKEGITKEDWLPLAKQHKINIIGKNYFEFPQ